MADKAKQLEISDICSSHQQVFHIQHTILMFQSSLAHTLTSWSL